jgi:hypothetical protein
MSIWDFPTVEDTVAVFRAKWITNIFPDIGPPSISAVERLVDDLFCLAEEPSPNLADFNNIIVTDGQLHAAEERLKQALTDGVPAEDILLALYVGSDVVDCKCFKTFSLIHELAKRFIEAHPHIGIPSAFITTAPQPWRPIQRDDWDISEQRCHEIGLHYLMGQAAGIEHRLPWSPDVMPASNYRAPENYVEANDGEESVADLMDANSCLLMMQTYTAVILHVVAV